MDKDKTSKRNDKGEEDLNTYVAAYLPVKQREERRVGRERDKDANSTVLLVLGDFLVWEEGGGEL